MINGRYKTAHQIQQVKTKQRAKLWKPTVFIDFHATTYPDQTAGPQDDSVTNHFFVIVIGIHFFVLIYSQTR